MSKQNLSRRRFIQASLATGASALTFNPSKAEASFFPFTSGSRNTTPRLSSFYYYMKVPELFGTLDTPPSHSRNLIIGSGFGGAVSALRLAQAGESVTVLERGFKWPNSDWRNIFSNDILPDGRAFWFKNKVKMLTGLNAYMDPFGGVMDATEYDNMTVWRGSCVGGGSVIFTGVMIQPDQTYFDALFQGTVSYAELDNIYYPRVKQMLNLSTMPNDIYQSDPFGHSRVWDEQVRNAGYSPTGIDSIFNWSTIRSELYHTSRKSATVGMSNHGNSNGAKFDLNQNYLSMAEATGNAKVYPGQEVLSIGWNGQYYEVEIITRSVTGQKLSQETLTCDRLFMAAGSIGTTELLVKAQAQGSLTNLNQYIGEGWGSNGDAIVVRSFSESAGFTQGTPSASMIHDTSEGMPVTLENWYAPGVPVDVGIIGSLGMAFDQTNRGKFVWNPVSDKVDLQWAADGNADAHATLGAVNARISDDNNVPAGAWPFVDSVNGMNWTAHPLGGAVIGLATDDYGRIKGHPGLYVMDGAAIPRFYRSSESGSHYSGTGGTKYRRNNRHGWLI